MEMLEMRNCEFVYFGLFYRGYESYCFDFRLCSPQLFLRRLAAGGEVQRKAAGKQNEKDEKGTKSDKEVDVKRRNKIITCF